MYSSIESVGVSSVFPALYNNNDNNDGDEDGNAYKTVVD